MLAEAGEQVEIEFSGYAVDNNGVSTHPTVVQKTLGFQSIDEYTINLSLATEKVQQILNSFDASYISLNMVESVNIYNFGYSDNWDITKPYERPNHCGEKIGTYILSTDQWETESYLTPITIESNELFPKGNIGIEIELKKR